MCLLPSLQHGSCSDRSVRGSCDESTQRSNEASHPTVLHEKHRFYYKALHNAYYTKMHVKLLLIFQHRSCIKREFSPSLPTLHIKEDKISKALWFSLISQRPARWPIRDGQASGDIRTHLNFSIDLKTGYFHSSDMEPHPPLSPYSC